MKAWQGSYGVSKYDGIVSPAYFVFDIEGVDTAYFHLAIRSRAYVPFFTKASDGVRIGQWDLVDARMREIPFFVPSHSEQVTIVHFLSHVNRRIQQYMSAKKKLIKLLEEQKQAIINRAVTRGLDPNVSLKPSGVESLGDIPVHWEMRTLGQIAKTLRTGPFGSILHQSDYVDDGIPVINPIHMRRGRIVEDNRCSVSLTVAERLSQYVLQENDLVFARRGELGRCALVRDREAGWLCGTGSIVARIAYDDIEPEYLIEFLQTQRIGEYMSLFSIGATMENLNTGILKRMPLLLPPLREQRRILECTTNFKKVLNRAISRTEREISLLLDYLKRLTVDVVTGKVDVRTAVQEMNEDDAFEVPHALESEHSSEVEQTQGIDETLESIEA